MTDLVHASYIVRKSERCQEDFVRQSDGDLPAEEIYLTRMIKESDTGWRDRLTVAIADSGMSRAKITEKAGLGRAFFHGIYKEEKEPSLANLLRVCKAMGADPAWVIFGYEITPKAQELLRLLSEKPDQIDAVLTILRGQDTA